MWCKVDDCGGDQYGQYMEMLIQCDVLQICVMVGVDFVEDVVCKVVKLYQYVDCDMGDGLDYQCVDDCWIDMVGG